METLFVGLSNVTITDEFMVNVNDIQYIKNLAGILVRTPLDEIRKNTFLLNQENGMFCSLHPFQVLVNAFLFFFDLFARNSIRHVLDVAAFVHIW